MTHDPHDFEPIQRLLVWKRLEQPPPGYFDHVRARVRRQLALDQEHAVTSWWQQFLACFDLKPVFACAYGVAMGALLLSGLGLSQRVDAQQPPPPALNSPWLAFHPGATLVLQDFTQFPPAGRVQPVSSVNPVIDATDLFLPTSAKIRPAALR